MNIQLIGLEEFGFNGMIDFLSLLNIRVHYPNINQGSQQKIVQLENGETDAKSLSFYVYCDLWDYVQYAVKHKGLEREDAKKIWLSHAEDVLNQKQNDILSSYAFMQQPVGFFSCLNETGLFSIDLSEVKQKYIDFYQPKHFYQSYTVELIRWCKEDTRANQIIKELHQRAVLPHDLIKPASENKRLVDIVIPCYNLGHLLEETLASIERSFNNNFSVLIIDDGSTQPETQQGLKRAEEYGYKVVYQKNAGLCNALNNGLAMCENELVLILSADDMLDPLFVTKSIEILNATEEIGVVYCNPRTFEAWHSMWLTPDFDPAQMLSQNFIVATSVFRKKHWEKAGGYDPMADGNEDWDMWMSCLEQGAGFHHVDEYLFHYRYREGSKIQICSLPDNRKKLVSYMSGKHHILYEKHLPSIIGNLHYIIATTTQQKTEGKSIDQIEVEAGAKQLGIVGSFMYRSLRKVGHLVRNRK
ncbi:MAG: glycosyltransferase [Bacteroidota bacterium]